MKNIFGILIFILTAQVILSFGGSPKPSWEKENVSFPMMNQEIRHTMQENDRQKEMRKKQTENAATETVNKGQWTKFKETTTKIQDRLRIISFAVQSVPAGIAVSREIDKIEQNQQAIIQEINTAPYAIIAVLPAEIQFVDDLQMVVRLMVGIIVSYGAINQMEKSERKILLDFALEEIKTLRRNSAFMLMKIKDIKEKISWKRTLMEYYINRDRQMVQKIMSDIKSF
jgi:hypothetical protein